MLVYEKKQSCYQNLIEMSLLNLGLPFTEDVL
jgi:hypothetical protein